MTILAYLLLMAATMPVQEQALLESIDQSGRCQAAPQNADERVKPDKSIAPGLPPLLSFRYYQGKQHQRFGNVDLMMDDAGH